MKLHIQRSVGLVLILGLTLSTEVIPYLPADLQDPG